jgi:fumarate reductase subunit D
MPGSCKGAIGEVMRRRYRSFIGTIVMLVFLVAYSFAAMLTVHIGRMRDLPVYLELLSYAVLGLAWVLPAMPLVRWMVAPDEPASHERVTPHRDRGST